MLYKKNRLGAYATRRFFCAKNSPASGKQRFVLLVVFFLSILVGQVEKNITKSANSLELCYGDV